MVSMTGQKGPSSNKSLCSEKGCKSKREIVADIKLLEEAYHTKRLRRRNRPTSLQRERDSERERERERDSERELASVTLVKWLGP
jgi:hypothetical protein